MEPHVELVRKIARRVHATLPPHASIEVDDLLSAGMFGLANAIDGFDADRGLKFNTFAQWRIRGAMLDWLRDIDWVPRLVRARGERATVMKSMNEPLRDNGGRAVTLGDRLADLAEDFELPIAEDMERLEPVVILTKRLSRRERAVFVRYWYLGLTMKEIGATLDICESRVSQIQADGMSKIKRNFTEAELLKLLMP